MKPYLFKTLTTLFTLLFFVFIITPNVHAQTANEEMVEYADNVNATGTNIDQIGDRNLRNIPKFIVAMNEGLIASDGTVVYDGAIPSMSKIMAFMVTQPPAQTSVYIADVLNNSGFAQPAYAQGIGFSSLTPVLQIWKAFRNIAYFFFIVIFVVIGFMIMFRKQIDHQAVVTVQLALPQIVLTLLLITFSYAIAGFVVDLIYLTIFLFTNLFQQFGIIQDAAAAQGALFKESIWRIGWHYFVSPIGEVGASSANSVNTLIHATFGIPGGLKFLTDVFVYAIIVIAIIIAMFRTILTLVGAYIGIILSVIFAPIQLLFNAIPGSNTFNSWLRTLVANAAVFPAVAIMVLLGAVLSTGGGSDLTELGLEASPQLNGFGYGEGGGGFVPPLLVSEPNSQAFGLDNMSAIIGLGILMLLPEIAKIVKETLQVKDPFGELAMGNLAAGYQKGPVGWAGGLAKTTGGYLVGGVALGGANKIVDVAQRAGYLSRDFANRFKRDMQGHNIATGSQAAEHADDFKNPPPSNSDDPSNT